MKIAVVTDSTAYLTPQEAAENQITVVPIPLVIDGQSYQEGVDITTEEFYDKLAHSKSFPSTSQPSIGLLMETYQKLADEGYDAVIRRMALRSAYRPAAINGAPVTSVSVQVQKFAGGGN